MALHCRNSAEKMLPHPWSPADALIPPIPPPLPPPICPTIPVKKKLYQALAEGRTAVAGDYEEACSLFKSREHSFRKDLEWLLFNKYVPSLIQDGPQCGLVALWMAGHRLNPEGSVTLETIVHTAVKRGYTAQGEMFSASNMALLAEELYHCQAHLMSWGAEKEISEKIVHHLVAGLPVLIPYDEDFNHEPCQRNGHRAHWAAASGVLLGVNTNKLQGSFRTESLVEGLFYLPKGIPGPNWPPMEAVQEVYLLAKQGKSLKYQLWELGALRDSNQQLKQLDPKRSQDGQPYVLPEGGVQAGLCGQVLLLRPADLRLRECQSALQTLQ
uniref:Actin maturation protease n=1 Tax=Erpetoichthys calabaricus TaxID=27687 RepID=A0A8C4X286_ERPCA